MPLQLIGERAWPQVILTPLSITGFVVTVSSTMFLKAKTKVTLTHPSQVPIDLEVKKVLSYTEFQLGPPDGNMLKIQDYSAYSGGTLTAQLQERYKISPELISRAVYSEEPTTAIRTVGVDWLGRYYTQQNPLTVDLADTSIDVNLTTEDLKYQIFNLSMPLANTDYVYPMPSNIRRFTVKIRDAKGVLRIYETAGSPVYANIARGAVYDSKSIRNPALNLYVQSSQPNCVLEIIAWVSLSV
jgi:hypothetical protein